MTGGVGDAREWFLVGSRHEIEDRIERFVARGVQLIIVQVDRTGHCADTLREFAETFAVTPVP